MINSQNTQSPKYDSDALVGNSAFNYTERLYDLIAERLKVVEALGLLSANQAALCHGDTVESMLGIIGRRESIVERLQAIQEQLRPYQADDPERRQWISSERREECRKLSHRTDAILKEVMLSDNQILEQMQQQRDAIAVELRNGKDSQLAQQAYESLDENPPSILDIADL